MGRVSHHWLTSKERTLQRSLTVRRMDNRYPETSLKDWQLNTQLMPISMTNSLEVKAISISSVPNTFKWWTKDLLEATEAWWIKPPRDRHQTSRTCQRCSKRTIKTKMSLSKVQGSKSICFKTRLIAISSCLKACQTNRWYWEWVVLLWTTSTCRCKA